MSGRVHRGMRAISQKNRHTKNQPRVTPLNAQCHISHDFTSFLIFPLSLSRSISLSLTLSPSLSSRPGFLSCRSFTGSALLSSTLCCFFFPSLHLPRKHYLTVLSAFLLFAGYHHRGYRDASFTQGGPCLGFTERIWWDSVTGRLVDGLLLFLLF